MICPRWTRPLAAQSYNSPAPHSRRRDQEAGTSTEAPGGSHYRKVFPARKDALAGVTAFTAEVCAAGGLGRDACLRLTLLVEELFTNSVVHGYRGDCDRPVRVALDLAPGTITLTYEDAAPPYDPFAALRPPEETMRVEERRVGGLGVHLVAAMAQQVRYSRVGDWNRISLVIRDTR